MRSQFRMAALITSLALAPWTFPGCSSENEAGNKMEGATDKGKMEGAMDKDKMEGAMDKGKMEGAMDKGKMDGGTMEK